MATYRSVSGILDAMKTRITSQCTWAASVVIGDISIDQDGNPTSPCPIVSIRDGARTKKTDICVHESDAQFIIEVMVEHRGDSEQLVKDVCDYLAECLQAVMGESLGLDYVEFVHILGETESGKPLMYTGGVPALLPYQRKNGNVSAWMNDGTRE